MGKSKKIKIRTKSTVRGADYRWVVTIIIATFLLSAAFSSLSSGTLENVHIIFAFLILLLFIVLGTVSDAIGVAVTTASEAPFHSMASHGVKCAPKAINIIRNAEKVSNICGDVIGDICGIVSGSISGMIVIRLFATGSLLPSILITSVVSALTVGGKAIGKAVALSKSNQIVYYVAYVATLFSAKKDK